MPKTKESVQDVKFEEAMDIAGYGKFSLYIILLSGLTMATSLLGSVDISFLLPAAECDLHLTSEDKGLLGSAFFIGSISASHLSGFLADTLGRRHVLVRALLWNVLTYVLGSLAPNIWMMVTLKIISGVLLSPSMIATLPFLGEFIPAKRRAQALLVTTSLVTLGILYSSLAGWLILKGIWVVDFWFISFTPWRLFYLMCSLPSMFCGILFYFTPESPNFLLTRGKAVESIKILQRVHSINSGKPLDTFPVKSISMDAEEVLPPVPGKGVIGVLRHIADQTLPVFKPPYLKNLILCTIVIFSSFFCVNGVFLWLPEVANRVAQYKESHQGRFYACEMVSRESGINFSTTSAHTSDCDSNNNNAVFLPSMVVAAAQPFLLLAASAAVTIIDRRIVIALTTAGCSAIAYLITVIPDASVIIILFGSLPALIMICSTLIGSITVELFPTYIRAMAVSVTIICGRLGSMAGSQMFSYLIDSHCLLMFWIISGVLICTSVTPMFLNIKRPHQEKSSQEQLQ